jgi:hypothetical protein
MGKFCLQYAFHSSCIIKSSLEQHPALQISDFRLDSPHNPTTCTYVCMLVHVYMYTYIKEGRDERERSSIFFLQRTLTNILGIQ